MPFQFETSKPIMIGQAGSRSVPDVVVRRRAANKNETFSMDSSQGTGCPIPAPPGAPAQFFRLNPAVSEEDQSDRRFQCAKLVFQGDPEAFHDAYFDPCLSLTQTMQVNGGVGPQSLPIELSCAMHPLHHLIKAAVAFKVAAVAVVVALVAHLKSFHAPQGAIKREARVEPTVGGSANDTDDQGPFRKTG